MPRPIRFLFDYISPYAYLAWTQVRRLADKHGRDVEPVPILLAGVLGALGTRGPAEVPPRLRWTVRDVLRTAARIGVDLAPPPTHPFNSLLALRVTSLVSEPAARRGLVDTLYRATWGGGAGVTEPAEVARLATEAGLDGPALVAAAGEPAAKELVKRQTEDALAAGAFGVPTMFVDDELFFGFESFPQIDLVLSGKDPLDRAKLARWAEIRPSAVRAVK